MYLQDDWLDVYLQYMFHIISLGISDILDCRKPHDYCSGYKYCILMFIFLFCFFALYSEGVCMYPCSLVAMSNCIYKGTHAS